MDIALQLKIQDGGHRNCVFCRIFLKSLIYLQTVLSFSHIYWSNTFLLIVNNIIYAKK